jgi:AMMECR1 domain-containing protein
MLFNLRVFLFLATALMFGVCGGAVASALPAANPHEMSLPEIARQTMAIYFGEEKGPAGGLDEFADKLVTKQHFLKSGGVFVTLSKHGKTRACWGSVMPQAKTIAKSTVYATMGALTKEYRYKPVSATEWKTLHTQVTVIKGVEPIPNISFQNPVRDGLLVRSGGKAGVLLPGEASDAVYQLVQCKLKAGIKSGESCQLYRLRTEIYE